MERFSDFIHGSLKPGSKEVHKLQLFETAGRTMEICVFSVKGRKPGPVLLAAAGIHGDEYEGVFAVQQFFKQLNPDELCGTFIGIPVCNSLAFENISRESPAFADGLNLAREFPGDPHGSYTQRLAGELMSFVLRNLNKETDVLIDLHSAGTRYEYLPMIGAHVTSCFEREKELCRATGIQNLWELNKNPKSLNGAASEQGIMSLGAEIAGRGGARAQDVDMYVNTLRSLCGKMGLTRDKYAACREAFLPVHTQKFEHSGLFSSSLELGCTLKEGDEIGTIRDVCGDTVQTVTAACGGVLWGIRRQAAAYSGEVAYLIAKNGNR